MYETDAGRHESGYRCAMKRMSGDTRTNPYDLLALETAISLREKLGGTVTVLTMGPPQAETMMRDAYACGADDAVIHSVLLYIARIPSAFLSPYPRCMYILRTRARNSCKDSRKPYREAPVGLP